MAKKNKKKKKAKQQGKYTYLMHFGDGCPHVFSSNFLHEKKPDLPGLKMYRFNSDDSTTDWTELTLLQKINR